MGRSGQWGGWAGDVTVRRGSGAGGQRTGRRQNPWFQEWKEIGNMWSIVYLVARNEMCHLRESVHNDKYWILSISNSRQSKYKIHTNVFPRLIRNRERHVKTMRLSFRLSFATRRASGGEVIEAKVSRLSMRWWISLWWKSTLTIWLRTCEDVAP